MRTITVTEKHKAVNEGRMSKSEFVRQMRQSYPMYISPQNGYDATVQILKNKQMLFEEKEYEVDDTFKYSDDSLRRAIDIELEAMGLMSHGTISMEDQDKAKKKAIANLKKDPLHYYHLISGDSSKVNKHDKPVEVKKGNEVDTFNGMKKATLKEAKQNLEEGTRALVGYLAGNRLTTAYNHYDGYPSGLGKGLMTHYNNDDLAKDIAMKGYITSMDPDSGEISQTHQDPPKKITLPEDSEEMAREVAEEIDGMGADYGYIWHDEMNQWHTIKNTGIRSMIDQITDKMGMQTEVEEDIVPAEEAVAEPTLKETLGGVVAFLKSKGAKNDSIKDFIKTHKDDIQGMSMDDVEDEYNNFLSVNTDYVDEKKSNVTELKDTTDGRDIGVKIIEFADGKNVDINVDYHRGKTKDFKNIPVAKAIFIVNQYIDQNDLTQASTDETGLILQVDDGDTAIDIIKSGMSEKKVNEDFPPSPNSNIPEANAEEYDVATAFKKAGVDMSKPVTVFFSYGSFGPLGGDEKNEMSAEAAIKKLEAERQDRSKQYTDDGDEVPEDHHGYEYENTSVLEEFMPEGHEYKLAYFQTGDAEYAITQEKSGVSEKKGKDHDGDGDIDSDDYMAAKDKAIKKAMGKEVNESVVKKNIKSIITKILEEEVINEAATNDLAKIADEYEDFGGLKPAVISLQNIVTEIESFYDKTREKIQKVYDSLGNVTNDEGLKVGAFITPAIENAFKRDLKHIIKNQFTGGLSMPQVRRISQDDIDRGTVQQEAPKDTVFSPVNEKKNKNEK